MKNGVCKAKILIVDDLDANRMALREVLSEVPAEIMEATSGNETLSLMLEHEFALVLMDVNMPGLSGIETVTLMRGNTRTRHTPVIFITALGDRPNLIFDGYEAGGVDYLTKPIDPHILKNKTCVFLDLYKQKILLKESEVRFRDLADFATAVLHNVSNVLNSMNVAGQQVNSNLRHSQVGRLTRISKILEENKEDPTFLTQHPRGKLLPRFLETLSMTLEEERTENIREMTGIRKYFQLMQELIANQQSGANKSVSPEIFETEQAIQDALEVTRRHLEQGKFRIHLKLECQLPLLGNRARFIHVMINLIKNAVEAATSEPRRLEIKVIEGPSQSVLLSMNDNGEGIDQKDLHKLFSMGYSTKKKGHGFGLPYCMRTMIEMGGSIEAASDGLGKGATFTLKIPCGNITDAPD